MSKGGFAKMDPERRRELARKGGEAAHRAGTAHRFTSEEATVAGKKGAAARTRNLTRATPPATTGEEGGSAT